MKIANISVEFLEGFQVILPLVSCTNISLTSSVDFSRLVNYQFRRSHLGPFYYYYGRPPTLSITATLISESIVVIQNSY